MSRLQSTRNPSRKLSQEEIFANYNWHDKSCLLFQINNERCDYIQSRVERVFGQGALREQEVLDVGCGGGLLTEELARRGAIVTGIDPSQEALAVARARIEQAQLGQNVSYQHGYAEALPYDDGSFSVITCFDTLEHVRDLGATIQEIARVLAPGGIFIFDTINRTLAARIALIWIGERFFAANGLLPGLHNYSAFIKPRELLSLLTVNGLQPRALVGFMPRGFKNGRLLLGSGWFMGVSYVGYATKGR